MDRLTRVKRMVFDDKVIIQQKQDGRIGRKSSHSLNKINRQSLIVSSSSSSSPLSLVKELNINIENNQTRKYLSDAIDKLGRGGGVSIENQKGMPLWLSKACDEILEGRGTASLRMYLKDWMILTDPDVLNEYKNKELGWSWSTAALDDVIKVSSLERKGGEINRDKTLDTKRNMEWDSHRNKHGLNGGGAERDTDRKKSKSKNSSKQVTYSKSDVLAFTHFLLPSRYAIATKVLNEVSFLLPNFKPTNILDFGCGVGTILAAITENPSWKTTIARTQPLSYVGVDRSKDMLSSAELISDALHSNLNKNRNSRGSLLSCSFHESVSGAFNAQKIQSGMSPKFDLSVASFVLSEMSNDFDRQNAVDLLFESLNVGGVCVLIDRGNPIGSHAIRTARQYLLDKNSKRAAGAGGGKDKPFPSSSSSSLSKSYASVIAPCTHDKECPLHPGKWCSFTLSQASSLIGKTHKYSYVILQKCQIIHDEDDNEHLWLTPLHLRPKGVDTMGTMVSKMKANFSSKKALYTLLTNWTSKYSSFLSSYQNMKIIRGESLSPHQIKYDSIGSSDDEIDDDVDDIFDSEVNNEIQDAYRDDNDDDVDVDFSKKETLQYVFDARYSAEEKPKFARKFGIGERIFGRNSELLKTSEDILLDGPLLMRAEFGRVLQSGALCHSNGQIRTNKSFFPEKEKERQKVLKISSSNVGNIKKLLGINPNDDGKSSAGSFGLPGGLACLSLVDLNGEVNQSNSYSEVNTEFVDSDNKGVENTTIKWKGRRRLQPFRRLGR